MNGIQKKVSDLFKIYFQTLEFKETTSYSVFHYCTARQHPPLRRKFMEYSITNLALSLFMKQLVIGQRKKAPNFSARQCSPLRRKFMGCTIINPALSLLMKHLVIRQHQKAPNFSAFHWSLHGRLVSIGQHFVTTRVVHLSKRTDTSLITE